MKVKKFKQILENSGFDTTQDIIFKFYGKKRYQSYYTDINTHYNIEDSISWYDNNIAYDGSFYNFFGDSYTEIVLVEKTINYKILDIDDIKATKKYNL